MGVAQSNGKLSRTGLAEKLNVSTRARGIMHQKIENKKRAETGSPPEEHAAAPCASQAGAVDGC